MTAEAIFKNMVNKNRMRKDTAWVYSPIYEGQVIEAMKEFAKQEREKAFEEGFKRGTEIQFLYPDFDSEDEARMKNYLEEYTTKNPLI